MNTQDAVFFMNKGPTLLLDEVWGRLLRVFKTAFLLGQLRSGFVPSGLSHTGVPIMPSVPDKARVLREQVEDAVKTIRAVTHLLSLRSQKQQFWKYLRGMIGTGFLLGEKNPNSPLCLIRINWGENDPGSAVFVAGLVGVEETAPFLQAVYGELVDMAEGLILISLRTKLSVILDDAILKALYGEPVAA